MKKSHARIIVLGLCNFFSMMAMEAPPCTEQPTAIPKIIFTKHARDKMAAYNLAPEDVELIIKKGQGYLDTKYEGAIIYREINKSKPKLLSVATRPIENSNNILIVTVFYANQPGNIKPRKKR